MEHEAVQAAAASPDLSCLSVVIPTLEAARVLGATLDILAGRVGEIVIADAGSADATQAIALAHGARIILAPRGRGGQIAAGIAAARGAWLLILHADTQLQPGWIQAVADAMRDPGRAAYFRFTLDDASRPARRLQWAVALRCRWFGLPYGDQGLLIACTLLDQVGGVRPMPLMEDVDLILRIGKRRLTALPVAAVTSAERFRRGGWLRTSARNVMCLGLWFAGASPERIRRIYAWW
ncbi:TIGR04283 family arsenosugar biosynthesis glycosyltransferase [Plastoroseomonas arctica]|uniref:Glycosyltransferase n=1 Tax=Plastoroseomonas arctica TaxID=1509237 RepID=A0AAF1JZ62_9PROT|nr:TIGR04283 family arsenosugar biosynthesis glycosyltransferase [Plastoroseomonas arctica]MBR0657557.1 glycosyltransferase [Plastoroseomonas arctica]